MEMPCKIDISDVSKIRDLRAHVISRPERRVTQSTFPGKRQEAIQTRGTRSRGAVTACLSPMWHCQQEFPTRAARLVTGPSLSVSQTPLCETLHPL